MTFRFFRIYQVVECWCSGISRTSLQKLKFYLVGRMAYFLSIQCFLLGYNVICLYIPYLFQPDLPLWHERILELHEEILDLNQREAHLEHDFEDLPLEIFTSSSEVEKDSAPD